MPSREDFDSGGTDYLAKRYHIDVSRLRMKEDAQLDGGDTRKYRHPHNISQEQPVNFVDIQAQGQQETLNEQHGMAVDVMRQLSTAGMASLVPAPPAEDLRAEVESAMIVNPEIRRFMERVMLPEWCLERYPRVYAGN